MSSAEQPNISSESVVVSTLNSGKGLTDAEIELTRKIFDLLGAAGGAEWLHAEVPSLQKRTPLSFMPTAEGRGDIERVLGRIEHGIFLIDRYSTCIEKVASR